MSTWQSIAFVVGYALLLIVFIETHHRRRERQAGCARPMSAERDVALNAKDNPSARGDGSGDADPTDRQPGLYMNVISLGRLRAGKEQP